MSATGLSAQQVPAAAQQQMQPVPVAAADASGSAYVSGSGVTYLCSSSGSGTSLRKACMQALGSRFCMALAAKVVSAFSATLALFLTQSTTTLKLSTSRALMSLWSPVASTQYSFVSSAYFAGSVGTAAARVQGPGHGLGHRSQQGRGSTKLARAEAGSWWSQSLQGFALEQ